MCACRYGGGYWYADALVAALRAPSAVRRDGGSRVVSSVRFPLEVTPAPAGTAERERKEWDSDE